MTWDALTPREAEVLAAVERRLTNAEIAAEMYVSVRTVETHIAALRRKLGVDSRAGLVEAARARRARTVPVPHNSFVGREHDVERVRALLERDRWVTLVGPAGCGKTRLALEVAAADPRVPVVAELEHARSGDVASALARAVGMGVDSRADLVAACGVALRAQPYLLVLDNGDRVAEAVRAVVGRLLTVAPSLTVLATSQTPLGGSDETVYPLSPLSVDGSQGDGAVRLFLDRARAAAGAPPLAGPAAEPTPDDVELARRICHRLDGLPLAIELAAARVRHLPLQELAQRLDEGLAALESAGPVSRHRTLAAAFDWTWDLLDADEQSVLSRLAALPRTFDLDLAEAVTAPGSGRVVLRLLDRSLVATAPSATVPRRFRLLAPLRDFVLERTAPEVVQDVRRRHAAYHAVALGALHRTARTDDSREAAADVARLSPEATAAVDWAIGRDPALALSLGRALAVCGEQYGPTIDSLAAVARVARDPEVRAVATSSGLLELGMVLCYGDLDLVADLATLARDKASDPLSELAARHLAGYAYAYRDRPAAALEHLEVAEQLAERLGDVWQLASIRQAKGLALAADPEAAIAAFASAMQTFARAGDAMHVNNARYMMAASAVDLGSRRQEAVGWAEQCAAYARSSGNGHELAHALLTGARLRGGPVADADLADAMDAFRTVGDLRCLARATFTLADARAPAERVPLLEQALDVAQAAHDVSHQERALDGLVQARWASGDRRGAATAYGSLARLSGRERASKACPEDMLAQLDEWETAVAEGEARAARVAADAERPPPASG